MSTRAPGGHVPALCPARRPREERRRDPAAGPAALPATGPERGDLSGPPSPTPPFGFRPSPGSGDSWVLALQGPASPAPRRPARRVCGTVGAAAQWGRAPSGCIVRPRRAHRPTAPRRPRESATRPSVPSRAWQGAWSLLPDPGKPCPGVTKRAGPDFSLAEGRTRRLGEGGWPACGVAASEARGGESLSTRLRGQDLKVRSEPHPASARPLRLPRLRPAGSGPGALRRCPVLPGGARNPIVPSRDTFCCLFLFFLRLHFPRPSQIHRKSRERNGGASGTPAPLTPSSPSPAPPPEWGTRHPLGTGADTSSPGVGGDGTSLSVWRSPRVWTDAPLAPRLRPPGPRGRLGGGAFPGVRPAAAPRPRAPGSSTRLPWPTACFFPALGDTPLSGQAGVGAPSPTAGRLGDFRVGTAVNIECEFPCGRALGKLQRVRWPGWGAASVSREEPPGRLQSGRSVRRAHRQPRVLPAPGAPGRASDGRVAPSPGSDPAGCGTACSHAPRRLRARRPPGAPAHP